MAASAWLIEIVAGATWRFATRPLDYDGHRYAPGLAVSDDYAVAMSLAEPTDVEIPITIDTGNVPECDLDDVAQGATATLWYWPDPDSGDPLVAAAGALDAPEYGGPGEPLTASVLDAPWDDQGLLPTDPGARVDSTTWPLADDADLVGEWYPIVFGEPGIGTEAVVGSPALGVGDAAGGSPYLCIIAQHPVLATTVRVRNNTDETSSTETVVSAEDGAGRTLSCVNLFGVATYAIGEEIWVSWDEAGGGMPQQDDPTQLLTGAGDVVEYLLRRSTLRIDWGRQRAARHALNAYRIDTYIQGEPGERVTPWKWLADHVLPLFPVAVRRSPDGYYLAALDPRRPASAASFALEAGRNCARVSAVAVAESGEVANDLRLRYAPHADSDRFAREVVVTGDPDVLAANTAAIRSAACAESIRRFGRRSLELSTRVVYDRSTAVRLLLALAARVALPSREVVYIGAGDDFGRLEPGDTVTVTDSALGWSAKVATVWTVRRGADTEVTLRLWPSSGRDV